MSPHRDYLGAPEFHRWSSGTLLDLWARLNTQLRWKAREPLRKELRVWFVLYSGALVSLHLQGDRRVCRIARRDKPKTADNAPRWDQEIETFVRFFGLGRWQRVDEMESAGVAVRFLEPVGVPACANCQEPLDRTAQQFGRTLCTRCGIEAKWEAAADMDVLVGDAASR